MTYPCINFDHLILFCRNSLGILAAGRIEAEIETVTAELKFSFLGDINSQQTNMQTTKSVLDSILGSGVLGSSKRFLGILESDMQDECELNLDGKVMGERNPPDSTSYIAKERSPFGRPLRTEKVKTELLDAAFADGCLIRENPHKNKNDTLLPGNGKFCSKKIEFCGFISSDNGKLELLKKCAGGLNNEQEGPHLGFNETMAENKQLRRTFTDKTSNNVDWKNKVPYDISRIKSGHSTANPYRTWSVANADIEGFPLSNVFPVYPPSDDAINRAHKKPPEEPSKSPKSSGSNVMETTTTGHLNYSLKADGPKSNQNPMQAIIKQNSETTSPEVLSLEEGNNGNIDVNERCTDAYTDLNNKFSFLKADEFVWTCLINRAVSIVQVFRMLSVHHPESSQYIGPLFGPEIDKENYELFSDTSKWQLRNILREAESLLPHSVTFPSKESSKSESSQTLMPTTPSTAYCIGHLRSYQGLRTAINFLLYLSRLLPYEDIYWRIQRRLTGIEPMIDFGGSDARSRAIVMRGILELIATLHRRGMEISEASKQLCVYLSYIVTDLSRVASVLNIILRDKTLPEENFSIGSWELNQEQRSLPLIDIFSDLSAMYAAHSEIFSVVVRSISAFAEILGIKASIFFVEPLMSEIFQANAGLATNLKREALGMLCTLISAMSDNFVNDCNLSMSAEEIEARKTDMNRVCLVLVNQVVPYLELMVQKEYQMRGLPVFTNDNLPPIDGHGSELKSEYIEALAQCYGFLLESGYLSWSQVEEKIAYPYSFRAFWRQANTAYRRLGIFMVAHVLANAPNALKNDAAAVASARTWLMAISDIGGRQCLTYLTETLRRNRWTAPLFNGTQAIPLVATDTSSDTIRCSLIFVVLSRLAARADWKNTLIDIISDLDIILASRKKELQCTAFDPVQAVSSWETTETKIFLSVGAALVNVIQLKDDKVNLLQLPGLKDIIAAFHKFVLKAVSNMLGACNTLQRSMHIDSCKQTALDSKFTSHGSDEDNLSLCSLGEIRSKLRKSAFGCVGYLINLLYQVGAPNVFDHCMEFWEIFTSISMGVVEIGTGNATPSLVDTAIFEAVAAAMTSAEDCIVIYPLDYLPLEYQAYRPNRIDRDARLELCLYFLNGFARRTLSRANLPHVSNERRAINVIRICDQLLKQPLFLENKARFDAFRSLMWPTIEVLLPEENRRISIASKDAVYSFLKSFVSDNANFLPNLTPWPTECDGMREIIHQFWVAICQDALDCVKNVLPADLVTKNISAVKSAATSLSNIPTDSFIWPWGECEKANARNNLLKASHIDDRFSSLDKLLTKTSAPGIPQLLGHTPSYNFRPGDFGWDLASNALGFLQVLSGRPKTDSHHSNFGSIDQFYPDPNDSFISNHTNVTEKRNQNIYWVLASFPALHAMIPCTGSRSKRLHEHYKRIRELLEKEFGENELSIYPLQAPNEKMTPHFDSCHGEHAHHGCRLEEKDKIRNTREECHLDDVLKAEPGQRLNVVAVLNSVHDKSVKFRMPTAVGHLENVKKNGEKVEIKLMAGQKISPKLATKLIEMNSKKKLPCIIHLVDATVSEPSGHRILVGTRRTQITFSDRCSSDEM